MDGILSKTLWAEGCDIHSTYKHIENLENVWMMNQFEKNSGL